MTQTRNIVPTTRIDHPTDFNSAREFDQADATKLRPALEDLAGVVCRRIYRPWTRAVRFERRAVAATINIAAGVCTDALVAASARSYEYIGDGAGRAELRQRAVDLRNAGRMP